MKQVEDSEILAMFAVERTRNEAFNLLLKKYQQKFTGTSVDWYSTMMIAMI